MAKHKIHFGNENKARSFSQESGGKLSKNKGNSEKPYTVSFTKEQMENRGRGNSDFNNDINGNGTHWHTSEDL